MSVCVRTKSEEKTRRQNQTLLSGGGWREKRQWVQTGRQEILIETIMRVVEDWKRLHREVMESLSTQNLTGDFPEQPSPADPVLSRVFFQMTSKDAFQPQQICDSVM